MVWRVFVDVDKCTGDGVCVDICPVDVFELQDGIAIATNDQDCIGCESCVDACEQKAITVEEL